MKWEIESIRLQLQAILTVVPADAPHRETVWLATQRIRDLLRSIESESKR